MQAWVATAAAELDSLVQYQDIVNGGYFIPVVYAYS